MYRFALIVILPAYFLSSVPLWAGALEAGESARVESVIDGDTLILENGVILRLVGIQAPKPPLGHRGFKAWPLADEAKAALEKLSLGQRVTPYYGDLRNDRYGRAPAHLYRDDGLWIQGEMLALGMARVYSFGENSAAVPRMLIREAEARAAGRGVWRDSFYAVRRAELATILTDRFELVEGRVRNVATVRNHTYLNFGDDWRVDFTLRVDSRVRRLFERLGTDLDSLEGQSIRVRGWVKSYNGPMIDITHPEQIEILGP